MKYRSIDIQIVIILTIIAATLVFIVPASWVPLRILTLPLVLVLPGYALSSALFIHSKSFGIVERFVLSLGLSIVIVILSGLVLNWMPFGLRSNSWAVLLSCITLGSCVVALIRRREQNVSTSVWSGIRNFGFTFRQRLLLGAAAIIIGAAVAVSIVGAKEQSYAGFTQLWILPASRADESKNIVHLGVSNMESKAMQYRLAVDEDGKVIKEWLSINLNPNEKWEVTLVLPRSEHTATMRVEAMLYRSDAPNTIYRRVYLLLST